MVLFLFVIILCLVYKSNGQSTTAETILWDYKIGVDINIEYTLMYNATVSLTDVEFYCLVVLGHNETHGKQFKIYATATNENANVTDGLDILIDVTIWTNDQTQFNEYKSYVKSDDFKSDLTDELEDGIYGMIIENIDTEITETHGDDENWYDEWLDPLNYTWFNWLIVGGIIFVILICFGIIIYCLFCKASKHTDPYHNVQLSRVSVGGRSPSIHTPNNQDDVKWVQC